MILETWLNETLKDEAGPPEVLLKGEKRSAMASIGIDRVALFTAKVGHEEIDRLYRGLFVYSFGFYELIARTFSAADNKHFLITAVWQAFSHLLERCCHSDYQLTVARMEQLHKQEVYNLTSDFTVKKKNAEQQYKELSSKFTHLQKILTDLEVKYTDEKARSQRLEHEIRQSARNQEEEVQLRLRFEAKLNQLHSVQRELQQCYARANEELSEVKEQCSDALRGQTGLKVENSKLRAVRTDLESQVKYQKDTVTGLVKEIEQGRKRANELERTLRDRGLQVESLKIQVREQLATVERRDEEVAEERIQIDRQRSDKQHILGLLEEAKEMKTKYRDLMDEAEAKRLEIAEQLQEEERKYLGKLETEKYLEEKVKRIEIERVELEKQLDEEKDKLTALKIKYDVLESRAEGFERDLEKTRECQEATNQERLRLERAWKGQVEQIGAMEEVQARIDDDKQTAERQWARYEKRFEDATRKLSLMTTEKERLEEEVKHMKSEMAKKEETMKEALGLESRARFEWAAKYDMLVLQGQQEKRELFDAHKQLKSYEISMAAQAERVRGLKSLVATLEQGNKGVTTEKSHVNVKNDRLERDVAALKKRIQLMVETHALQLKQLEERTQTRIQLADQETNRLGMEMEDVRMHLIGESDLAKRLGKQVTEKRFLLRKTERDLDEKTEELNKKKEAFNRLLVEYMGLKQDYADKKGEYDALKGKSQIIENQVDEQLKTIEEKEEEVLELRSELGSTKLTLKEKEKELYYFKNRDYVDKETDTAEFDAFFTAKELSRLQRAAASTPSSRGSVRPYRNKCVQTGIDDIPEGSQRSLFSGSERSPVGRLMAEDQIDRRGRSHPVLPFPILLGQQPALSGNSSGFTETLPRDISRGAMEISRGGSPLPLEVTPEENSYPSRVQSSRRPIEGVQKLAQTLPKTARQTSETAKGDKQSIYSSYKSLEGQEVLRSVYTTSQLGRRSGPFTPMVPGIFSDSSFPEIKRERSKFSKPRGGRVQIRSSSHLTRRMQMTISEQPEALHNTYITGTTGGSESPEPQQVQEIRVDVSRQRLPVRGGLPAQIAAQFQSQESFARRTMGTMASGGLGGISSLSSYRFTRGDETRSGTTMAGTQVLNMTSQRGSGPVGASVGAVGGGIKRMIRAAAGRAL